MQNHDGSYRNLKKEDRDFRRLDESEYKDLPLGKTYIDTDTGYTYIYIGRERNTAGYNYFFHPEMGIFGMPMSYHCSTVDSFRRKFDSTYGE